ncbi:DUF397 domain-containing protein [Actinomadura sp. WMMA1423]|uniref:DUF397 domain-containing protein n=1 Tax=Actinomadura sp. WMMA1423 TaxID=2591108 RepID=UPI0011472941|nr:DUF397 domain-containing protein [Actinomadura sp. WMMA1423]
MNPQDPQAAQRWARRRSGDTRGQRVEARFESPNWRKSSYSTDTGDQCIELASIRATSPDWRKRSGSDDTGAHCAEVADLAAAVAVRDSRDPSGPQLVFGAAAWEAFAGRVKGGHLDLG